MGSLRRFGLVDAVRGARGGYRLRRPADGITLMEVAGLFDPVDAKPECILRSGRIYSDDAPCPVYQEWKVVRETYRCFLSRTTLSEMAWPEVKPVERRIH